MDSLQSLKLGFVSPSLLSQPSSAPNKRRERQTLWYISVWFVWFIIQLPSNMFQLGSNFFLGLAAAVAKRQLNIYILLSSGKQTGLRGSAAWAVKLFYLCACLHNFNNIFTVNECIFYPNHDLAQRLSGDKMQSHKMQRGKSNNLSIQYKRALKWGWSPSGQKTLWGRPVSATWRSQQPQSRDPSSGP